MIHIIRDGRDVVTSHRDRWGYKVAMRSINDWKTYVTMANEFGKKVSSDRYIEIRYEELVTQPENILRGLFTYLNEPWDPVVLKHNEVEHDMREVSPGIQRIVVGQLLLNLLFIVHELGQEKANLTLY
jgi:hypothetical protein